VSVIMNSKKYGLGWTFFLKIIHTEFTPLFEGRTS